MEVLVADKFQIILSVHVLYTLLQMGMYRMTLSY